MQVYNINYVIVENIGGAEWTMYVFFFFFLFLIYSRIPSKMDEDIKSVFLKYDTFHFVHFIKQKRRRNANGKKRIIPAVRGDNASIVRTVKKWFAIFRTKKF